MNKKEKISLLILLALVPLVLGFGVRLVAMWLRFLFIPLLVVCGVSLAFVIYQRTTQEETVYPTNSFGRKERSWEYEMDIVPGVIDCDGAGEHSESGLRSVTVREFVIAGVPLVCLDKTLATLCDSCKDQL